MSSNSVVARPSQPEIPPNLIPSGCEAITPEMLPLVNLTAGEIERIVSAVPGGAANIQDIYPLAPLQEEILCHLRIAEGEDASLLGCELIFDTRAQLESYLEGLQAIIDRHDILRTAMAWEGLPEPVQVVWRHAELPVEEVELDAGAEDAVGLLFACHHARKYPIDVRQAPLLRAYAAYNATNNRWLLILLLHPLAGDRTMMRVVHEGMLACQSGLVKLSPAPEAFRSLVAQARLAVSKEEHEAFFRQLLRDIEEPTAPFGLLEVRGDCSGIEEAYIELEAAMSQRLRAAARRLRVSPASLFHLAWAQVLARTSGREDVVFGTALSRHMQEGSGAEREISPFTSILPVRIHAGGDGIDASARRTHRLLSELTRHEHASLTMATRCSRVAAPAPLFTALLNYRWSGRGSQERAADEQLRSGRRWQRAKYPVTMLVDDLGDDFRLTAQVESSIGPERVCEYIQIALASLLEALEADAARPVRTLEILPESERQRIVSCGKGPKRPMDWDLIAEVFEAQARRTPESSAVVQGNVRLPYRQLNARANQLANHLRARGVKLGDLVAICLPRTLDLVIGILGVLKAGAAYLPLDPNYPSDRIAFILNDARPALLLGHSSLKASMQADGVPLCWLDDAEEVRAISEQASENLPLAKDPDALLYVIYTSGSTGQPKGAGAFQQSFANLLQWYIRTLRLTAADSTLLVSAIGFDLTQKNVFAPLLVGGTLHLPASEIFDPAVINASIETHSITWLNCTPSTFHPLVELQQGKEFRGLATLRWVLLGGEPLQLSKLRPWTDSPACSAHILNTYGPAECTDVCIYWQDDGVSQAAVLGQPIDNALVFLLDRNRQPVPQGVPGEIWIGGACLGSGYLNRPALNAEKFAEIEAFGGRHGMYCSGDWGRWRADGMIDYLGRADNQVKIRGFRIELGEIEAQIGQHPSIHNVAVIAREDVPGEKRLVAYCVAQEGATIPPDYLRNALRSRLPDYMVPSAFVFLPALPLSPNGKVDRRSLPAPEVADFGQDYVPPRGPMERKLTGIWEDVLGIYPVGVKSNFFDIGGTSLLVGRLVTRILRDFGKDLPLSAILQAPTVEALAVLLRSQGVSAGYSTLVPVQTRGSKPPIFGVHGGLGTAMYLRAISVHLGTDQPVYGLELQGLDGRQIRRLTVEQMARQYIAEILRVQPAGPYFLVGYCFGGIVAFEMAQQLAAAGERAAFVGLLNAPFRARLRSVPARKQAGDANADPRPPSLFSVARVRNGLRWRLRKYRAVLREAWPRVLCTFFSGSGITVPSSLRDPVLSFVTDGAEFAYHPRKYSGRLVLFNGQGLYADREMGWTGLGAEGLEIHEVGEPGQRMRAEIVNEPLVGDLARKLNTCLTEFYPEPPVTPSQHIPC